MRHIQQSRRALLAVSYLFLIIGLFALIETVGSAIRGSFHFNFAVFGILGIGIFLGLRRHSRVWHRCALLYTWYLIVTLSVALIVCLCGQSTAALSKLGKLIYTVSPNWVCVPLAMWLLVTLRQYRVLRHPAIRRLFVNKPLSLPTAVTGDVSAPAPIHAEASHS